MHQLRLDGCIEVAPQRHLRLPGDLSVGVVIEVDQFLRDRRVRHERLGSEVCGESRHRPFTKRLPVRRAGEPGHEGRRSDARGGRVLPRRSGCKSRESERRQGDGEQGAGGGGRRHSGTLWGREGSGGTARGVPEPQCKPGTAAAAERFHSQNPHATEDLGTQNRPRRRRRSGSPRRNSLVRDCRRCNRSPKRQCGRASIMPPACRLGAPCPQAWHEACQLLPKSAGTPIRRAIPRADR